MQYTNPGVSKPLMHKKQNNQNSVINLLDRIILDWGFFLYRCEIYIVKEIEFNQLTK